MWTLFCAHWTRELGAGIRVYASQFQFRADLLNYTERNKIQTRLRVLPHSQADETGHNRELAEGSLLHGLQRKEPFTERVSYKIQISYDVARSQGLQTLWTRSKGMNHHMDHFHRPATLGSRGPLLASVMPMRVLIMMTGRMCYQ